MNSLHVRCAPLYVCIASRYVCMMYIYTCTVQHTYLGIKIFYSPHTFTTIILSQQFNKHIAYHKSDHKCDIKTYSFEKSL